MRRRSVRRTLGRCGGVIALLFVLPGAAWPHIFTPPVNPLSLRRRILLEDEHIQRFSFGAFWSRWDVPTLHAFDTELDWDPTPSPVFTGEYYLSSHWSIGGFWNPYRGEMRQSRRLDLPPGDIGSFDAEFWELHATFYGMGGWAKDWSLQLGYSGNSYDVEFQPALRRRGVPNLAQTFHSPSLWITKVQHVRGCGCDGDRVPIDLYASAGYYLSSEYDHVWSVIAGGSVGLTRQVSLSGSVWFYDLSDLQTRITVGLTGKF